tara:strand:+ start:2324 stop:2566 length:243 start_codon:yes stop_codon:yes gene_type:complete
MAKGLSFMILYMCVYAIAISKGLGIRLTLENCLYLVACYFTIGFLNLMMEFTYLYNRSVRLKAIKSKEPSNDEAQSFKDE